jgi:predicted glycogen debranching enzyme
MAPAWFPRRRYTSLRRKPVEIQALWLNALRIVNELAGGWGEVYERGLNNFRNRFWNPSENGLYDVVDVDHQAGAVDGACRPNQIFAVGGLPFPPLDGEQARRVVQTVEERMLTPVGLRSLAPGEPGYRAHYEGGVWDRDSSYHRGTVWVLVDRPLRQSVGSGPRRDSTSER